MRRHSRREFLAAGSLAIAGPRAEAAAVEPATVRIGLASIRLAGGVAAGVEKIRAVLRECREKQVEIVCFPETYLPGLRGGVDKNLPPPDQEAMDRALKDIRASCSENRVAAIVGMEWQSRLGLENRAFVIGENGRVLGHQTKNQITPGGESKFYVADGKRRVFTLRGVKIGVVICHEGWRYPETVRWAAVRGAKIVFQPQVTGSDRTGDYVPKPWGQSFYEMAMQCRAEENSIYFPSVNRAMTHQNSATSLIGPNGKLIASVPCGQEMLLVADLDLKQATGFYANRYQPSLYQEGTESDA
ncbi:MAG TPA: carbon-nitrogen hydrolase family protein [Bryobacteraceae bacterium]|nr:carbon-nitrogen hydrolase family protein [Bryobacteraceae bacterium]